MICPVLDLVQRPGRVEPIQGEDLADFAYRYPGPAGREGTAAVRDVFEAKQRPEYKGVFADCVSLCDGVGNKDRAFGSVAVRVCGQWQQSPPA